MELHCGGVVDIVPSYGKCNKLLVSSCSVLVKVPVFYRTLSLTTEPGPSVYCIHMPYRVCSLLVSALVSPVPIVINDLHKKQGL
jgi:hypothetical protein